MKNWFSNLKVRNKFLVEVGVILSFLVILCGTGVWGAASINNVLQTVQIQQVPSIMDLAGVLNNLQGARVYNRQALLETEQDKISKAAAQVRTDLAAAYKNWQEYLKLPAVSEEKVLWPKFESDWQAWTSDMDEFLKQVELNTTESKQKAEAILPQLTALGEQLVDTTQKLADINFQGAANEAKVGADTYTFVVACIIIAGLLLLALSTAVGILMTRSITGPLKKLNDATKAVTAGDLTQRAPIKTKDEIGGLAMSFNLMVGSITELNREITRASQELNGSAAELLALVNQQTAGASEQSAAIHQTTSTVNEVKATIDQTNQRASVMSQSALHSASVAEEGFKAVTETVTGMNSIKEQVETIAENILALSEQTQQIGDIITTVNDIAEQSNLLALNAAVEAARAGEHGRGFAVVANEVRNLAERSKQATAQVRTILSDIQKATNAVVMVTEEGTKGVDHGVRLVDRAGNTIRQLSEVIRENLSSTQQIMAAVQQQNVGVEQVAQAMSNINAVTNQNVSANRQIQQSVEGMNNMVTRFSVLTNRYRTGDGMAMSASS